MDENRITTLEPRQKPPGQMLIDELREAIVAASAMGVFERLERCHNVKRCQWLNQRPDGRLPESGNMDRPIFRWPGAPDLRIPMADKIVRWLVMLRMSVVNRGDLRIGPRRAPVGGASDGATAGDLAKMWQSAMEYFVTVQDRKLKYHAELFATVVEEFGYGIMLADWEKKRRMERLEVTLQNLTDVLVRKVQDDILQMAQEAQPDAPIDPQAVLTPDIQQQVVMSVQVRLEEMLSLAGPPSPDVLAGVRLIDDRMTDAEARKVVAALRKSPGAPAEFFAPKDDGGVFDVEALVPWVNCLHPHDMGGDGSCDWFAIPRYWSEAKILERAAAEGWAKAAVDKLLANQRNKFFTEMYGHTGATVPAWVLNDAGVGMVPDMAAMEKMPRWLVVYVWKRITNEAGLPMIYKGVVHPSMPDDILLWQPTDLTELPFVTDTAEVVTYAMMSRGVADIVADKQNAVKDLADAEASRGQLGSNPPLNRTLNDNAMIYPGAQFYTKRSGTSGNGNEFMQVPPVDVGSIKLIEKIELMVDQYYFRAADTAPEEKRMFAEGVMFRSLRVQTHLMRVLWQQVQEHIEALQLSRLNDRDVSLNITRDQIQGEADINIAVHLDGYGEDAADKFVEVFGKLVQVDQGGAIDRNEGMQIAAQLLSPTYASRLVLSADAASNKVLDDQEIRIAKIMAGVPVRYDAQVSNPKLRQQALQQWAQMPGNVQRAQSDPLIAEMLQKEAEMLQFQDQQQNENPQTGRAGVKPNVPGEVGV